MAGQKSHHVTLGIYDLASRKITYLDTGGDPEHYLTNICWSPDGNEVYIAEINRDQNHTTFNAYNPVRGNKIRTLYEEQSLQYTEPLVPYTFVPQQNSLLIAQSKRDGWNSLTSTHEGELVRQLTRGIEVTEILGFDNKNKVFFFKVSCPILSTYNIFNLNSPPEKLLNSAIYPDCITPKFHSTENMPLNLTVP
jgi:hypothetical protein